MISKREYLHNSLSIGADPQTPSVLALGSEMSTDRVGTDEIGTVGSAEDGVTTGLGDVLDAENQLTGSRLDACDRNKPIVSGCSRVTQSGDFGW